jgi:hypothetical protein
MVIKAEGLRVERATAVIFQLSNVDAYRADYKLNQEMLV